MADLIIDGHLPNYASTDDVIAFRDDFASAIIGRAVTDKLHVSPNGNGNDGLTWDSAYTTIQDALDAASIDGGDCTLIVISPHATNYDINTTGDPTWTGNYILKGTHRNWTKIKNTHAGATSIMKLTGKASIIDLNFNLHTGSANGVILTHGGWRVYNCQFVGENLTGAATALEISNGATIKHGKIHDSHFDGHISYMTAINYNNVAHSHVKHIHIHDCLKGVHILHADSDLNIFHDVDFDDNDIAVDIDAGNRNHFTTTNFDGNATNIDDEVGDHIWEDIRGEFTMENFPDDFNGITLTADASANVWGTNIEVRAVVTSTVPFRIVGYSFKPGVSQFYKVRFTADGGSTYFDEVLFDASRQIGNDAPSGTEYIFNKGTQIMASTKAESGGSDTVDVWLKIQEI